LQLLHLTPYVAHPPNHGGRIRSLQLLRAARDAGHRVVNIGLARDAEEAAETEAMQKEGLDARAALIPAAPPSLSSRDRAAKWTRLLTGRSSLLPRWRHPAAAALVAEAVRTVKFDLVVVDTPWMDVYRREFGRARYVASTQNVEGDVLAASSAALGTAAAWAARRDAALLLGYERRWAARAAAVVTVSEDDARRFREVAPSARTVVAPNATDIEGLRPLGAPPADGPLLFVASYDYPPNGDAARWFVHEILPAVRAALGPVEVVLAGREPSAETRALAAAPGVTVTGGVRDLGPYYAKARAVIAPLRFGGGSRLKLLEAFALGRPVVSTRAGAAGLAARHDRELLLADDAEAFASALRRLRDEVGLAERLGREARAFVEARHGWPASRRVYAAALEAAFRT
jgi:polysaccharide biosynthesis protein PslH